MEIHVPDDQVAGKFAVGVQIHSVPDIITFDFIVDVSADVYAVVQRIRLLPSALEPVYLELGEILGRRRESEGGATGPAH